MKKEIIHVCPKGMEPVTHHSYGNPILDVADNICALCIVNI